MFNDADGADFKKVVIACGYTDGRLGINGLASLISLHYRLDPYEKGILFLFCGRKKDRCRAILWEGDGFLLLTKGSQTGVSAGRRMKRNCASSPPGSTGTLWKGFR